MQQKIEREVLTVRARIINLVAIGVMAIMLASAAQAETGHRLSSATAMKRWKQDHWEIRAEPGQMCVAMAQYGLEPKGFWGFIQTGPKLNSLELFFDSDGPAQPKNLQISYNDALNPRAARVFNWAGMDSYVVNVGTTLLLASFPEVTDFAAYSDGKLIWSEREFHMSKVEAAMLKCWEWQIDHS